MKGQYLLPILTGILVGTSYIPFPPWAIFFCLVPLWISWLNETSLKRIFWTGWIGQFVFNLVGFNWIAYTIHEFGHLPWIVSVAGLFLFCALTNLYIPLVGVLWKYLTRRYGIGPLARIWLLPVMFAITERIFPMIFDWHFGYGWLWSNLPVKQLADLIGFLGLSSLTLLANGALLHAWWNWKNRRAWIPLFSAVPVLFILLNLAGHYRGKHLPAPDANLRFLIVQANIENQDKLMAEAGGAYRDIVMNRFTDLSFAGLRAADGPVDFVVWPETAFPDSIETSSLNFGYAKKLKQFVQQMNTKLIVGAWGVKRDTNQYTNSFFVLNESGEWMAPPYHKTTLLAFGEYIPIAEHWPWLKRQILTIMPEIGDYGRGPGPTVLDVQGLKIGAQICYEGLFDTFSRDLANKGAQVIVNLTNDSWYGKWQEPYQHLYMTLVRAIETRRPLVRSTNTGISTVILANGEILKPAPLHEEAYQLYEVPYNTNPQATLFMGWGFWIFPVFLLSLFVFLLLKGRERR